MSRPPKPIGSVTPAGTAIKTESGWRYRRRTRPDSLSECTEPGCGRKPVAKGLCMRHYQQRRRREP